ncbi:MAG: hypothetical protein A2857_06855 [Candidatus Levybacteria bacterium RIFCSPHIGHO2_01_FULL_36_15]|nr:MAG: hypothetical protein A2857_06855 [Candidatus Levybacteria bacterium RIFCSPHIGHO2_01_FULL_36_15]OGH37813.1 MAG: hypothetical protein A2905_00180 [Candidatus Levybacteria bacterium RIFCSPLOWO2_01_FULL_36_10]
MDEPNIDDKIQEGEIVDSQASGTTQNNGVVLVNLEDSIKSHISSIERLYIEIKKHKETLDSIFLNDPTFADHSEKAKEANKVKAETRQQILRRPTVMTVANQIKNMKSDIKELQTELSDYLQEYQRLSGANVIEGEDGELREIINIAKVVKKSSR